MSVSQSDRTVLRELGSQIAAIAVLPVQQERIAEWKALNGLQPRRPMFMIDQIPWHEMDVDDELVLRTEDPWSRGVETQLRRTLYKWRHMPGDMVVEPWLEVGKVIRDADFGVQVKEKRAVLDPENDVIGHYYIDQLQTLEDVETKIREPHPVLDEEATAAAEARAREVFEGVLEIKMQGLLPVFAAWDRLVTWHGAETVLMDLVARPDFAHALMARFTKVSLSLLDQLEPQGLLGWRQGSIHCTGAYADELPAPGSDPAQPRSRDLWTYGMAQMFSSVSPAMHKEFWLDYAVHWFERFGLGYYGCCEPLHHKLRQLKRLPNLRRVSISPWANVAMSAEELGSDYVFSWKPNPAIVAGLSWDPEAARHQIREFCRKTRSCVTEIVLKDLETCAGEPQRLTEWLGIAREVVEVEG